MLSSRSAAWAPVDWFTRFDGTSPHERIRQRMLVIASFTTAVTALLISFQIGFSYDAFTESQLIFLLGAPFLALNAFLLRLHGRRGLPTALLCMEATAVLAFAAACDFGLYDPALIALPLIPPLATFLRDARLGWIYTTCIIIVIAGFYLLTPDHLQNVASPTSDVAHFTALALVATTLVTMVLAGAFDRLTSQHIAETHDRLAGTEGRLREHEAWFKTLFESAGIGIGLADLETGQIVDVNPSLKTMLGYDEQQLRSMRLHDLVDPDAVNPMRWALIRLLKEPNTSRQFEQRFRTRSGKLIWGRTLLSVVTPTDDGQRFIVGMLEDVTQQRQAQEALAASEARYQALFESSGDAILLLEHGMVQDFNRLSSELLGRASAELIGLSLAELSPDSQHSAQTSSELLSEKMLQLEAQDRLSFDWRFIRGDGSEFEAEVTLRQIQLGPRQLVQAIIRDISQRKEFEQGLIEAKEQAEEVARLKSAIVANMSHEIRTPLASILGFADVLAGELEREHSELVYLIRNSGQRLLETLNSMIDLARLQSDTLTLEPSRFNLADAVRGTFGIYAGRARERGLQTHLEIRGEERLTVHHDRTVIDRVLSNVLSNAIKFTLEGEVHLEIDLREEPIRIRCTDTGVGISPDFLPHAFEAFRQESFGDNRDFKGSGLGLTTARHLLEASGGSITLESAPGEGTTVTIDLPSTCPSELLQSAALPAA